VKALLENVLAKPYHVKWIGVACVSVATPKSICILEIDEDMPEKLLSSERTLRHAVCIIFTFYRPTMTSYDLNSDAV
jgi:hypothetical protein